MQFPKVKTVTATKKYLLFVEFTDGTKGNYDLSHLSGIGVFKAWDINDNFFKVFVESESGAISWPGESDIDTINVYCAIKGIDVDSFLTKEHNAIC